MTQLPATLVAGLSGQPRVPGHRPGPRLLVKEIDWMVLVDRLRHSDWTLLSLWAATASPVPASPEASIASDAAPGDNGEKGSEGGGRDSGGTETGEADKSKATRTVSGRSSSVRPAADEREICAAIRDNQTGDVVVVCLPVPAHGFPSIARVRPIMALLEQAAEKRGGVAVADRADGLVGVRLQGDADAAATIGGASMAVGPAAAGIGEPVRFLVEVANDRITGLGTDLGYTRRGIEAMLTGRMPAEALRLICRISANAPVALSWAFAAAVESALEVKVPLRAVWLRALMAELERIGRHLRYCAGINADAGETALADGWLILRERLLRVSESAFGHRLMFDSLVPGGVADDLAVDGRSDLRVWLKETANGLADIVKAGGAGRAAKGRLAGLAKLGDDPVTRIDLVGPAARAAGRLVDARLLYGYAPYDRLKFTVPDRRTGDALARLELRVEEIRQSLSLIRQLLEGLPEGAIHGKLPRPGGSSGAAVGGAPAEAVAAADEESPESDGATEPVPDPEGMAMVEGPDGEVLVSVRLDGHGRLRHCHLRDPAWLIWPLVAEVSLGAPVEDLALLRRSLAADVAAVDL